MFVCGNVCTHPPICSFLIPLTQSVNSQEILSSSLPNTVMYQKPFFLPFPLPNPDVFDEDSFDGVISEEDLADNWDPSCKHLIVSCQSHIPNISHQQYQICHSSSKRWCWEIPQSCELASLFQEIVLKEETNVLYVPLLMHCWVIMSHGRVLLEIHKCRTFFFSGIDGGRYECGDVNNWLAVPSVWNNR